MEGHAAIAVSPAGVFSPSDEELLVRAGSDPEAFAELYHRHFRQIVAFAVRRCARPGEVADLVAAVWLEVIGSADRYDPSRGHALPWMLGIAANLAASEARRRARERQALERLAGRRLLEDDEAQRLEARIDADRIAPRVRDAVSKLPAGERAMVELVVLDGLTPAAAAAALDLDGAAGRMRLARARRKLRASLGDELIATWFEGAVLNEESR
jgi:RNA polymerase sigma-70 factor (ECF subfamily)